jgi:hypothetical protein
MVNNGISGMTVSAVLTAVKFFANYQLSLIDNCATIEQLIRKLLKLTLFALLTLIGIDLAIQF